MSRIDTLIATVDQLQSELDTLDRVMALLGMALCSLVVLVLILHWRLRSLR